MLTFKPIFNWSEMIFLLAIASGMTYLYAFDFVDHFSIHGITIATIPVAGILFIIGLLSFTNTKSAFDPLKIFTISWSLAFFLNRIRYSSLQSAWQVSTELYILFAPLLAFFLAAILAAKKPLPVKQKDNPYLIKRVRKISRWLIFIAYAILVYEFYSTGIIPILSSNINEDRVSYSLPFIHVISEAFLKLGCYASIYCQFAEKKRETVILITLSVLYFLISMSRSGIIEIAMYATFLHMIRSEKGIIKLFKSITIIFASAAATFALLGNIRQGAEFNVSDYSESRIKNSIIDWFYSYFAINLDNLALEIDRNQPTMNPSNTLSMPIQLLQLDDKLSWFDISYEYIGRLNLGTGLRGLINDWGAAGTFPAMIAIFFAITLAYKARYRTNLGQPIRAYILVGCFMLTLTNRFLELIPVFLLGTFWFADRFLHRHLCKPIN